MSAENQVHPFCFDTPDGEKLFAWHILPLSSYIANEDALIKEVTSTREDFATSIAFKLLADDPESRLVINCRSSTTLNC